MTWADFYLICFAVGFAFSLISFLGGGTRWRLHLPHLPHGGGHFRSADVRTWSVARPDGAGQRTVGGRQRACAVSGKPRVATDSSLSPFNFVTFTAFLAWFGGTGYLLTRYSSVWFAMGLGIAHRQRPGRRRNHLPVSEQSADLGGREHGSGGLRNGGRAGPHVDFDSRRRHRRNYLLAGRHAADLRRAQRRRRAPSPREWRWS